MSLKVVIFNLILLLFIPACSPYRSKSRYKDVPPMTIHSVKVEICIPDIHQDDASVQYTNSYSEFKPAIL